MSTIVLVGKNGAGKDTLLNDFLKGTKHLKGREDDFQILSMSNLLRNVQENDPKLWEKIDAIMKSGGLVPDEIILDIAFKELAAATKPVICNGFPRTMAQAEAMVAAGYTPDAVVVLNLSDAKIIQRAKDRVVCSKCKAPYTLNDFNPPKVEGFCDLCGAPLMKRPDDEEEIVKKRLQKFYEETDPTIDYFAAHDAVICHIYSDGPGTREHFYDFMKRF